MVIYRLKYGNSLNRVTNTVSISSNLWPSQSWIALLAIK